MNNKKCPIASGNLRGIDTWSPFVTEDASGGDTMQKQVMDWQSDAPVPWAVTLRQRQRDYNTADGTPFPSDFDQTSYNGGTCRARIIFDDQHSGNGEAWIDLDFGAQQQLILPPTRAARCMVGVAAGFQPESGSIPGGTLQALRAFDVVAYAAPCAEVYGSPSHRDVVLTDWVEISAVSSANNTFERRIPRGAYEFSMGFRSAVDGSVSPGITANVDFNDAIGVPLGGGPILDLGAPAVYRIPQAASRVRFVNPVDFAQQGAITWRIQP